RQIVRVAAGGPKLETLRPSVQLLRRITGLDLVAAFLQPGIDEVADDIGDRGISVMFGIDDRRLELAQQRDKTRRAETVVANLHHMTQRAAVELARQQL